MAFVLYLKASGTEAGRADRMGSSGGREPTLLLAGGGAGQLQSLTVPCGTYYVSCEMGQLGV